MTQYREDVAQSFHHALRSAGVDFAVYLPDSLLDPIERRFRICQRFYGELAARAYPRRTA